MMFVLAFVLIAGLHAAIGSAQYPVENHYLVYEVPQVFTYAGNIELYDQFDYFQTTIVEFDKFANPVEKNFEPYWDEGAHQTWWLIDQPMPEWRVDLDNQFGPQRWFIGDAHYLVLPAEKTLPTSPSPMYQHNHFKCYEVIAGPVMNFTVHLADQFDSFTTVVMEPVYFCNPCEKWVNGTVYPVEDPEVHLAVYQIYPTWMVNRSVMALDQFAEWQFTAEEAIWLVVPSWKNEAIGNKHSTWGEVKSLYR